MGALGHTAHTYFKRAVNEAGYLVQNPRLEKVAQDSRKHDWPSPHPTQGLHCDWPFSVIRVSAGPPFPLYAVALAQHTSKYRFRLLGALC